MCFVTFSQFFLYSVMSGSSRCGCGGCFFFQAEDGIRDLVRSRGLGDVYKRQGQRFSFAAARRGGIVGLCLHA